jgi:hypothetical protein
MLPASLPPDVTFDLKFLTKCELVSAKKIHYVHNVVSLTPSKMPSWDSYGISCNKSNTLRVLRTSSLDLLHNVLQPVLRLKAVIHLSAVISIL